MSFQLEWSKSKPQDKQRRSIFYAKGIYNKNVKITNWEQYLEAFPHDNDPYCPGSMNYFLSHYNKFGNESEDDRYQTITHIMLNQIKEKKDISECQLPKHMINFRSCKKFVIYIIKIFLYQLQHVLASVIKITKKQ